MNVVIAFPSAFANKQKLARMIKQAGAPGLVSVAIEDSFIVCQSSDAVEHASSLANLFGVEKVAIAKKAKSSFSDLSHTILKVGTKLIMPGHSFYIKVVIPQSARQEYVSRDIEFAASGMLAARLASINAHPAKTETEAQDLILTVVGKQWAYVCIQVSNAAGGLVAGSQGGVLGSIHGPVSLLSCLMAARAGFEATILLPYTDESDLRRNATLAQLFATKAGIKKQKILVTPLNIPGKGTSALLLKEMIISKILSACKGNSRRIVLPLTAAVHPVWLIELIIQETVSAGRTPFAPVIFMSSELVSYAQHEGIGLDPLAERITIKNRYQKYSLAIESEAKAAIKRTKRLELKVGPNYLHDIIDSI